MEYLAGILGEKHCPGMVVDVCWPVTSMVRVFLDLGIGDAIAGNDA
jgi:hypothetical protein